MVTPCIADDFGEITKITQGTAYTLPEGEFTIGIISPMQYGVTDSLLLVSHPVLILFLTPNGSLRYNLLEKPVGISVNLSYIETFLDPKKLDFPGTIGFYPMVTIPASRKVAFTFHGGYLLDVAPIAHGVTTGGGFCVLLSSADLILLQIQDEYYFDERGFSKPTFLFTYTHAFYRTRITVGLAVGKFPVQIGPSGMDIKNFPLYPMLDLWWQL